MWFLFYSYVCSSTFTLTSSRNTLARWHAAERVRPPKCVPSYPMLRVLDRDGQFSKDELGCGVIRADSSESNSPGVVAAVLRRPLGRRSGSPYVS